MWRQSVLLAVSSFRMEAMAAGGFAGEYERWMDMADASSRPALRSQPQNLAAYDTIYIGFPIWWNLAPRIINSFIEKGDFTGKILIPFATSGGSRISNAEQELKKAYPSLNWQKGRLMNGATKEEIKQWTKK